MALTSECGPHCGIRANAEDSLSREAHCPCKDPCHVIGGIPPVLITDRGSPQPVILQRGDVSFLPAGTPMCARWYELAGNYRPWLPPHAIRDDGLVPAEIRPGAIPWQPPDAGPPKATRL
jgi:hypothetical protein